MLRRQLRIFAFIAIALGGLSTAAVFDCENGYGYIECIIKLDDSDPSEDGNIFAFSGIDENDACTADGNYCATVETVPEEVDEWQILVTNNGVSCVGVCYVEYTCDSNGSCYGACVQEAC